MERRIIRELPPNAPESRVWHFSNSSNGVNSSTPLSRLADKIFYSFPIYTATHSVFGTKYSNIKLYKWGTYTCGEYSATEQNVVAGTITAIDWNFEINSTFLLDLVTVVQRWWNTADELVTRSITCNLKINCFLLVFWVGHLYVERRWLFHWFGGNLSMVSSRFSIPLYYGILLIWQIVTR